jgi:AcrR family transcriptional regulator
VLEAGVSMADQQGVAQITMRALAQRLGFEVMSLYNHVRNKRDLLDGMVDAVAVGIELPDPSEPWPQAMRASCLSAHDALGRHRWVATLWSTATVGPARLDLMESWLDTLHRSRLSPTQAHRAFHALSNHVVGFALQQVAIAGTDEPGPAEVEFAARAQEFLDGLDRTRHPRMAEHVEQHLHQAQVDSSFGYVLDLILQRLVAEESTSEPSGAVEET